MFQPASDLLHLTNIVPLMYARYQPMSSVLSLYSRCMTNVQTQQKQWTLQH